MASTVTLYVNVTIVSIEMNFKINDRKRCGLRLTETKMPSRLELDVNFPYSPDLSESNTLYLTFRVSDDVLPISRELDQSL